MGNFIKNVFAVLLGLTLFTVGTVVFIVIIIGIASSDEKTIITENSILKLKLDKEIVERENEKLFSNLGGFSGGGVISLIELKESIQRAKTNSKIKGIYIDVSYLEAGFATIEEIRNELIDFKKSGKFIVAYGEFFSEGAYYIASVADKIILPESSTMEFNGLESEVLFFKGALDKLDIKVEVFKVGTYKSAVEPFMFDKMSEPSKLQVSSFLNSINNVLIENISKSRGIEVAKLKNISDSMLIHNAQDAYKYNLITDVGYSNLADEFFQQKLGVEKSESITYVSYKDLLEENVNESLPSKIAVIIANGDIISGKGSDDYIGSETLMQQIKKAREDGNIKAIVLRINSPGGSALASDVIWNEIQLTKGVKPIIASMGDVAASGGYYIAMGCDTIVAQPTTITGSIGVFGLVLNSENFLKNKLGITSDRVTTGKYSDIGSPTRSLTTYEKEIIQQEVNSIYETFTTKAAKGRNMPIDDLKKIAEGRVWSGSEALNNKLVDVLGGLSDAIEIAKQKAKLDSTVVIDYYPEQKNKILKDFMESIEDEDAKINALLREELGIFFTYFKSFKEIQEMNGIQARMPYKFVVH